MQSRTKFLFAFAVLASLVGAQSISNIPAPIIGFVDISTVAGAVQVLPISDDSVSAIAAGVITVGNSLFPAGAKTIGNNGAIVGGAGGGVPFTNSDIPVGPANPTGISATGLGTLMPYWDDMYPAPLNPTSIWYLNDAANGVAYFMWKDENHFASLAAGEGVTFEIQVFDNVNPASCANPHVIQYLYSDSVFGGTMAVNDNGASATVGYAHGAIAGLGNAKWSFNAASLLGVGCLTITNSGAGGFILAATSPAGAGDLQLDITGGSCVAGAPYFMAVTLNAGTYPAGWFFGIDIPVLELASELNSGWPFNGALFGGATQIGPFGAGALPSGLQFYALAMHINPPGVVGTRTPAMTYIIP